MYNSIWIGTHYSMYYSPLHNVHYKTNSYFNGFMYIQISIIETVVKMPKGVAMTVAKSTTVGLR